MAALGRRERGVNREFGREIRVLDVAQPNDRVAAGARDQQRVAVERDGEHEPVIVVGVFADQIDAAGRAIDSRLAGAIERVKLLQRAPIAVALRRSARPVKRFNRGVGQWDSFNRLRAKAAKSVTMGRDETRFGAQSSIVARGCQSGTTGGG